MLDDLTQTLSNLPTTTPCISKLKEYPDPCFKYLPVPPNETTHSLQVQAAEYVEELVAAGRLIKQEVVILTSFLVMELNTNSTVLDLCANSGLRALQILEHFNNSGGHGFVIANVYNPKKLGLIHKRFQGHLKMKLMVTNHDPVNYPLLKHVEDTRVHETYGFDRVVCFAPSSSDGFINKYKDIWLRYNWKTAYKMHKRQIRILSRAVELTKVDGRLIYMVGSMNPLEGEAVIGYILSKYKGVLELIDLHKDLSTKIHLKIRKGKRRWKVLDMLKKINWYKQYIEVPEHSKKYILPSMFTTPYTDINWKNIKDDPMNLHNCIRIYPHDQQSSGLFIAVMRKIKKENDTIYDDFYEYDATENPKVKQYSLKSDIRFMDKWMKDLYLSEEEKEKKGVEYKVLNKEVWEKIKIQYGIQKEFSIENLYYKKDKVIIYIAPQLAEHLHLRRSHRLKVKIV